MFTRIECGECGGTMLSQDRPSIGFYECNDCRHEVTYWDLLPNMDEGESLTVLDGVLGYITEGV